MADILVCDGSNLFVRAFYAMTDTPLQNSSGQDTTAVYTFLKSLRYLVNQEKPEEIYIIFDFGRDVRKKSLLPEYKENRSIDTSVLSGYDLEVTLNKIESMRRQKAVVIDILKTLPVKLVLLKQIEGDAIIAYVARYFASMGKSAMIVSNDKDFYQMLVDDKISIWNPHKKLKITAENINDVLPFKMPVASYRLYKCMKGDSSDNIDGIYKFGDKKIQQLLEALNDNAEPVALLDDFKLRFDNHDVMKKKYGKYFDEDTFKKLERNFELMDLVEHDFSPQALSVIHASIDSKPSFSKFDFMSLLIRESINTILEKTDYFIEPFSRVLPKK